LTKFICSLVIGISLLLIPQVAYADEVLIELTSEIAYVDTVVEVNGPTEYFIETTTGPRFEIAPSGINVERVAWVDSWIQLRQGEVVLRQDDDGNHNSQTNYYASKLTGTLDAGSYTIRATSYDYIVAGQRPIGTYTLSSNLINLPEVEPTPPETPPLLPNPLENQNQNPVTPQPTTPIEPVVVPPVVQPVQPEPIEPPIIPFEPPVVEEIIAPEPPMPVEELPVPVEEPPVPAEEPPTEPEIAPVEEELPPTEVDTPPIEEEAPPTLVEEPPIEAEEPPPVVTEESTPEEIEAAVEAIIEAADGEAITAEAIEEAGLTLEDLPSETPVEVRTDDNGNAVVITAEVAVALQVFDSPAELVSAIFDNPGQVLTAVANIGADMSDEEREESEEIIVASVIAGQAAINAAGMAAGTATRTSTPSSPAGGPMAGNDKPKSARRRKP
jgi:hypothetical protein